jgi:hypothetical protein
MGRRIEWRGMTDEQIIARALAEVVRSAAPLAVVYPWNVLGHSPSEWAALFRSPADAGRIHGWAITRVATTSIGGMSDSLTGTDIWRFLGVHYHQNGNETDNTDYTWQAEIDAIRAAFSQHEMLVPEISNHEEFQVGIIDCLGTGAELVHFAQASLVITSCN